MPGRGSLVGATAEHLREAVRRRRGPGTSTQRRLPRYPKSRSPLARGPQRLRISAKAGASARPNFRSGELQALWIRLSPLGVPHRGSPSILSGSACNDQRRRSTPHAEMQVVHLVARLRAPDRDLDQFEQAQWLWRRIEALFPRLIAGVLMPNHSHVLAEVDDPDEARHRLARTCGHLQRRLGVDALLEPLPPPEIVEPDKVARVARYIELNPSRAGLVMHSVEWRWSTLRDVAGATVEPAVDLRHHRHHTKRRRDRWLEYVGRDDRVQDRRRLGEPVPGGCRQPAFGIEHVAAAVLAATRSMPRDLHRRGPVRGLLIAAALDQGITSRASIARVCGCTPRAIRLTRHRLPRPSTLLPVRRCLSDPRLLAPTARLARDLATRRDAPQHRRTSAPRNSGPSEFKLDPADFPTGEARLSSTPAS